MKKIESLKIETFNPKRIPLKTFLSKSQLKEIKGGSIVEEDAVGI